MQLGTIIKYLNSINQNKNIWSIQKIKSDLYKLKIKIFYDRPGLIYKTKYLFQ